MERSLNGKKKNTVVRKNGQRGKKPFMLNGKKINFVKKDGKKWEEDDKMY